MRAAVIGAGELGVACALALHANGSVEHAGARDVTLFSRDPHTLITTTTAASSHNSSRIFETFANVRIPVPTHDFTLAALATEATTTNTDDEPGGAFDELFVCSPLASLVGRSGATAASVSAPPPGQPASLAALQRFARPPRAAPSSGGAPQFAAVFTRGLTEDGVTPAQLLHPLLANDSLPLLVASGPIFCKEWATQCSPPATTDPQAQAGATTGATIPPRPRGHLTGDRVATPSEAAAHRGLKRFSGTSLCFALFQPSVSADNGVVEAIRQQLLDSSFPRENVTVLLDKDAAAVLSLVNACTLLCAFGGGLVSNAFAGSSLSALASYTQHAQRAIQDFVNGVLGRPLGTPLPLEACSTLAMSCTNYSSREFALGRKMDFHFRHDDALNAVYGAHSSFEMLQTTDGIHVLLKKHDLRNPFLETLLDTFNTLLRASVVGDGLVKEGVYDFSHSEPCVVLEHALKIDEAMLSGDEDEFERAKKGMQDALGSSCVF